MRIPETVKIGPYPYRVELVEDLHDDNDRNVELMGQVRTGEQVIRIRASLGPEHQLGTLLHEAIHALDFDAYGIGLSEKQTKRLGVALTAFLLDNGIVTLDEPGGD